MSKKKFTALLKELENCKDITPVIRAQKNTLLRFEETNEMLRQFMELSNSTHSMLLENYTSHAKTLVELKTNLESSFRRIRALKVKLKEKYPDAFEATSAAIKELEKRHLQDDEERFDKSQESTSAEHLLEDGTDDVEQQESTLTDENGVHEKVNVEQSANFVNNELLSNTGRQDQIEKVTDQETQKQLENVELCDDATENDATVSHVEEIKTSNIS